MAEFNLIDKDWIPCIGLDGKSVPYGIQNTLLKAHELREICDDSPLVTVALHRLLLAILYRAFEGPSDMVTWRSLYNKGRFAPGQEIDKYLDHWWSRFYLFDEQHPFMQVAGLDLNNYKENGEVKDDKSDGLMRLLTEAPDKGGRILFDHRVGTERPEYEPKQIARMILSAQSYSSTGVAFSGKVGKQQIKPTPCQFAPCVEGLVLWLQGESLFHTLLLNLIPRAHVREDRPAWEDDTVVNAAIKSWEKSTAFDGPVQRFAPLSRFIRVRDRRSMFFTNGLKAVADSDDPMKAYSRPDDKQKYQAIKLKKDRAAWRDAHTLFSLGSSVRKPPASLNHIARLVLNGTVAKAAKPRANVVGLATAQGKALLWRHERMPVPLGILGSDDLTERLRTLMDEAEAIDKQLSSGLFWNGRSRKTIRTEPVGRVQAIADLVLAPSLDLRSPGVLRTSEGRAPQEAHNKAALDLASSLDPLPAYWARMEKHFFELLENLADDFDAQRSDWKPDDQQAATNIWHKHVKEEARRALEESICSLGTTARAIAAVARVRTDFNDGDLKPQPQKADKAKPKSKGGKKK
jgi:CRISPR system Cascade subunit CasA